MEVEACLSPQQVHVNAFAPGVLDMVAADLPTAAHGSSAIRTRRQHEQLRRAICSIGCAAGWLGAGGMQLPWSAIVALLKMPQPRHACSTAATPSTLPACREACKRAERLSNVLRSRIKILTAAVLAGGVNVATVAIKHCKKLVAAGDPEMHAVLEMLRDDWRLLHLQLCEVVPNATALLIQIEGEPPAGPCLPDFGGCTARAVAVGSCHSPQAHRLRLFPQCSMQRAHGHGQRATLLPLAACLPLPPLTACLPLPPPQQSTSRTTTRQWRACSARLRRHWTARMTASTRRLASGWRAAW